MRLVYKNPVELGKIFGAISVIVNEVNLDFGYNELSIFGLDSGHVSMIFLTINKEDFEEYECENPVRLGVNLKTLTSILLSGKDNDRVKMENNELDSINIQLYNTSRVIDYEIKLMEIVMEDLFIPDMLYNVKLNINSGYFYGLLDSIGVINGDEVKISVKENKIEISGSGQLGNICIKLENKEDVTDYKYEIDGIEELSSRYAYVFLCRTKKMGDIVKQVDINIGEDIPIKMEFKIGKNSEIKYFLASKLEE
jgi:proliferating cell nuclear antigen PCNA